VVGHDHGGYGIPIWIVTAESLDGGKNFRFRQDFLSISHAKRDKIDYALVTLQPNGNTRRSRHDLDVGGQNGRPTSQFPRRSSLTRAKAQGPRHWAGALIVFYRTRENQFQRLARVNALVELLL